MSSKTNLAVAMVVTMMCLIICPSPTMSDNKIIESACKGSSVAESCTKTLESDPAAWKAAKILTLAEATLNLMMKETASAQKDIERQSRTLPTLQHCAGSLTSVMQSLRSAREELAEDAESANYDVFACKDYVDDCKSDLASKGIRIASVSEKIKFVMNLISVGSAVTDALQRSS